MTTRRTIEMLCSDPWTAERDKEQLHDNLTLSIVDDGETMLCEVSLIYPAGVYEAHADQGAPKPGRITFFLSDEQLTQLDDFVRATRRGL